VKNVWNRKKLEKKNYAEKGQNGINMDIVVTIPKSEYKNDDKETEFFNDNPNSVQFWVLKRFPKNLNIGDRVYFIKNGIVESSMKVIKLETDAKQECDVTNRVWSGNCIYMNDLKYENNPVKTKGFQGFRYKWW
jgi:hypothetical protein